MGAEDTELHYGVLLDQQISDIFMAHYEDALYYTCEQVDPEDGDSYIEVEVDHKPRGFSRQHASEPLLRRDFGIDEIDTEEKRNRQVDIFFILIAKRLKDILSKALEPITGIRQSAQVSRARELLFGDRQFRDHLTGNAIKAYMNVEEVTTPCQRAGMLKYTPRYNPSNLSALEVYIKHTNRGTRTLEAPNFPIRRMLDPNCPPETPSFEVAEGPSFAAYWVRFVNGVLLIPKPHSKLLLQYVVKEHTDKCLHIDVHMVYQNSSSTNDTSIEKKSESFVVNTSREGENMLKVREAQNEPWMSYIQTEMDFNKNPFNIPAHPHITLEPAYVGNKVWICNHEHIFIDAGENTWVPMLGGWDWMSAYRQHLPEDVVMEFERFKLSEKLKL